MNLCVIIGGDGTLLWATGIFGFGPMPPVVAFNLGSLGFLVEYELADH